MTKIRYVKRKIGELYLVWVQNANQYFQLEEPAWFVFEKLGEGIDIDTVAGDLSLEYGFSIEESTVFVKDMGRRIEQLESVEIRSNKNELEHKNLQSLRFNPFSVFRYQLGTRLIKFSNETSWLEDYIHPLIAHLESSATGDDEAHFELFSFDQKVVFRLDGVVRGVWDTDESHLIKGRIFLELINVLHDKKDEDWLMTVHASAITNGKKTILFSAEPGSGKTTVAALLQARGYHLISDDFVPFDKYSLNAYPFPIAMSVKEGSMKLLTSLYPELEEKTMFYMSMGKNVRYLPIRNEMMNMIYPVEEIIFIKYDERVDFKMDKLEPFAALKKLFNQIWVPSNPVNVEILFDKLELLTFYELSYSDNQKALSEITRLFENEQ